MFKRTILAAALAAATSLSAHADEINYNYIEIGIDRTDYGNGNLMQDGFNVSGSVAIADNFYASGSYQASGLNIEHNFYPDMELRTELEVDYWNLNFGYHHSLNANNDFIAEVGLEKTKYISDFFVDDILTSHYEDSYGNFRAVAGLRTSVNKNWETVARLGLKQVRGNSYIDTQSTIELGIVYKINPTWAINFNTKIEAFDDTLYSLGVRAYFAPRKTEISSHQATADTAFSYTYVQAGISGFEHIYDDSWTGGYDVRGSYGFANNFYVHARYAQFNTGQFELHDERQYEIGFGYHTEITPNNDFVVNLARGTVNSGCSIFECTKETGYTLSAGIRTAITENLQARAMLGYNDGGNRYMYDKKTTASIDVSYNINEKFDVFFDTRLLNIYEAFYTFGVRAKF